VWFCSSLPCQIIFSLGVVGRFAGVRRVQLGEEIARCQDWCRVIVDDVGHRAVTERLIIVEGI
jgi:hypothetical protein